MSSVDNPHNANRYWRSLADRANSPEFRRFLEAEFPDTAPPGDISRRRWLQLMGASLALAGVGGCRWEKSEILPFDDRPPNRTPGAPQRFATAMDLAGSAVGLLVTCVDGRPIKIEGNPNHPASLGATDALAQAAVLELYDPDRSQHVLEGPGPGQLVRTWQEFTQFARTHFAPSRENGGAGFRVLAEASSSPTLAALRNRLLDTFPEARWHEYEPLGPPREAAPLGFDLAEAQVIVCLDDDLFASRPGALRYARQFAEGRAPDAPNMKRLYVVESSLSVTGAAAAHRLPLRADHIASFVSVLARQ
ncbi:MAG: TAT-variant-translocated molybdopterin oxidoreductase, partial [Planctomycetes bacterium]|nr:TAT-variant-translocated molybdopterin oxidoreductase [Planctomycetota bacterium]